MIRVFKIHESADCMEGKGKFIRNYPGYHQNITKLTGGWYKIVEWTDGDDDSRAIERALEEITFD